MLTEQQKQTYKDKIITEIYLSGEMEKLSKYLLANKRVPLHTYIFEDLLQETFVHLTMKSSDYLINLWEDNPRRVYGLCKTIMILKGLASKDKKEVSYNKHSLLTSILFASNLKYTNGTSNCHKDDEEMDDIYLNDIDLVEEPYEEEDRVEMIWGEIKKHLDQTDLDFISDFIQIQKNKKVGRYSNKIKDRYSQLEAKIKEVVKENKINIH